MENFKVMLITNMISPYRTPLFNAISKKGDFDFKVAVLAEREKNREWRILKEKIRFNYQVLSGWHWFIWGEKREVAIHLNRGVFKMLLESKPDIVITSGYDSLAYWQAFLYCKIFKKKFILWNETTLLSVGSIRGLRGLLKKIIIKGTDKYIVPGVKAKEYLKHLGAKCGYIFTSIDTVDMEYFRKKVLEYQHSKDFFYKKEKYPKIIILFVGQLIKRKGISQVLKALNILGDPDISFIIVGSGPEERNLKAFCAEKKLQNVFFEGFQQQEKLSEYYALADVFILPSFEEVWGLVVNEALASGLYVLSSKYAGASYDLIKEGWSGDVFVPDNVDKIVELIKRVKKNIEDIRKRRDDISKYACREFSIERSAQEFTKAIDTIQKQL
jgi:glycosyltransferase involved in cell wall biosynthesis